MRNTHMCVMYMYNGWKDGWMDEWMDDCECWGVSPKGGLVLRCTGAVCTYVHMWAPWR